MARQYGLPVEAIAKLHAVFSSNSGIKKATLYGSRAMGNYRTGSDIDLCIESDSLDLTALFTIEHQIDELLLPWKVDLSLKSAIDNPDLIAHIEEKGIQFYP